MIILLAKRRTGISIEENKITQVKKIIREAKTNAECQMARDYSADTMKEFTHLLCMEDNKGK